MFVYLDLLFSLQIFDLKLATHLQGISYNSRYYNFKLYRVLLYISNIYSVICSGTFFRLCGYSLISNICEFFHLLRPFSTSLMFWIMLTLLLIISFTYPSASYVKLEVFHLSNILLYLNIN